MEKVGGKLVKFDDQKTGYDVSIVDQEFLRNAGESMLVAKEETATRYFFFRNDGLYKMFLAFDKDILQGKSFRDFGKLMQKRFGKAREVTVQENTRPACGSSSTTSSGAPRSSAAPCRAPR